MDSEFLSQLVLLILGSVLTIVTPIISAYLLMLIKRSISQAETSLGREHYEIARDILYDLVRSAEARGISGEIDSAGLRLKEYVMQRAQTELEKRGIKVDVVAIEDLLESAYLDMTRESYDYLGEELSGGEPV